MNRKREFKVVCEDCRKFPEIEIQLPSRSKNGDAGYDMFSNETVTVEPFGIHNFWFDVKVNMYSDEHVQQHIRSSMGIKGWRNVLGVGIIDSGYYGNESNDGNIMIPLQNMTNKPMTINRGDRISQLIFIPFGTVGDTPTGRRTGGYGSTNK
jgi:dUTP pyrophosphatase